MFLISLPSSMLDKIPCASVRNVPCKKILLRMMRVESLLKEESLKVERETFSSFEGVFLFHFSPHSRKNQDLGLDGGFSLMHD